MDFDITNILYIVITLVAVIIGVLGKKKKPAEGGSGAPGSASRPSFLENLERVLTMDQEPARVTELQDYEEDLPAEEITSKEAVEDSFADLRNRPSIMEEYDRIMNQNQDKDLDSMIQDRDFSTGPLEVIDLEEAYGTDYFEIIRDFDAGTAIVYAAIINRLDY